MSVHNPKKDADQKAANRRKLLEAGYRLFTGKTIDGVSLEMVAKEAGIGVATLYRYFGNKTDLAIAVSVWKWQEYLEQIRHRTDVERQNLTGAENFTVYLNSFLNLYRERRDLLRYNQFFNVYLQHLLGTGLTVILNLIGLTAGGMFVDKTGVLESPKKTVTLQRVLGVLVMLGGAAMIRLL